LSTSGRYLRATIAGTPVKGVRSWEVAPGGDVLDASDSDSAPYADVDAGLYECRMTVRGIWDPALDGAFPGFIKGALLTNVAAYSNRNNAQPDFSMPLAMVVNDGQTTAVRGQIEYTFEIGNKGIFYRHGIAAAVS